MLLVNGRWPVIGGDGETAEIDFLPISQSCFQGFGSEGFYSMPNCELAVRGSDFASLIVSKAGKQPRRTRGTGMEE